MEALMLRILGRAKRCCDGVSRRDFLRAGACCLGVGGQLVEPKAVAERNFDRIRDLARQYVKIVSDFRKQ